MVMADNLSLLRGLGYSDPNLLYRGAIPNPNLLYRGKIPRPASQDVYSLLSALPEAALAAPSVSPESAPVEIARGKIPKVPISPRGEIQGSEALPQQQSSPNLASLIDFAALKELFSDKRATPAFYSAALSLINAALQNYVSQQSAMAALKEKQEQEATTRALELYKSLSDRETKLLDTLTSVGKVLPDDIRNTLALELSSARAARQALLRGLMGALPIEQQPASGQGNSGVNPERVKEILSILTARK